MYVEFSAYVFAAELRLLLQISATVWSLDPKFVPGSVGT